MIEAKATVIDICQRPSPMVSGPPDHHTAVVRVGPPSQLRGETREHTAKKTMLTTD